MLIVITGGSSGIGKQLAGEYLKKGNTVIIIADGVEKLEIARNELSQISSRVASYVCDVGDSRSVKDTAEKILAEYGCPDILVNNAGFGTYRTFDQTPYQEMEKLIEVNLLGAMRCTHSFLPEMINRRSGHIVFVASIGGLLPITPCAGYDSAKYGMVGIASTLRYELLERNIKVHLFCPGRIQTSFHDHETFRKWEGRSGMEKAMPVSEAVKIILKSIDKNRFLVIFPASLKWKYRLRTWFPFLVEPYFRKVMVQRIRQLREEKEDDRK